jgi:hypothetical protein
MFSEEESAGAFLEEIFNYTKEQGTYPFSDS